MSKRTTSRNKDHGYFQLDPVPAAAELSEFYESRYYDLLRAGGRAPEIARLVGGDEERARELDWLRSTLFMDTADYIEHAVPPNKKVLDVGCGVGDLVKYLGDREFDASGIDPSADAVRIASERGLNVAQSTLEDLAASKQSQGKFGASYRECA